VLRHQAALWGTLERGLPHGLPHARRSTSALRRLLELARLQVSCATLDSSRCGLGQTPNFARDAGSRGRRRRADAGTPRA
jgi:hypothetical protein